MQRPSTLSSRPMLIGSLCGLGMLLTFLLASASAKEPPLDKGWVRVGPLGETPKRTTDALPLSDQANEGRWRIDEEFTDEFDGDALDTDKWLPRHPNWRGRQPGFFSEDNVRVADGMLQLTMRLEEPPEDLKKRGYEKYSSALVYRREPVLYGYFEIRAKPMNSGGSSSFWFAASTPELWTEIDVFEIGGRAEGFERRYNMNLHVHRTPDDPTHRSAHGQWDAPWNLADDFHVYGLDWTKDTIRFYVDGVLVRESKNTHFHQPLNLMFDSETMPDWMGLPKDEDLPSTYKIDYVRGWKRANP